MTSICLFFQVHIPYTFRKFSFFDIGVNPSYEYEEAHTEALIRFARECYLPANKILLEQLQKYKGDFKVSFAISGTSLELFEKHVPEVVESFQKLAATSYVDFVAEPYYHSLASLYSQKEFEAQVNLHAKKIKQVFNIKPKVFSNTELLYTKEVARWAAEAGYKAILTDTNEEVNATLISQAKDIEEIKILLRSTELSGDITSRFSDPSWSEHPINAEKYAKWLDILNLGTPDAQSINLFLKYESFGMYHVHESGILKFLEELPEKIFAYKTFNFKTVSELAKLPVKQEVDIDISTWLKPNKDISLWHHNDLQADVLQACYAMEENVLKSKNAELIHEWRILQGSEHITAMAMFKDIEGVEGSAYAAYYSNPYDVYINHMNILADVDLRVQALLAKKETQATRMRKAKK